MMNAGAEIQHVRISGREAEIGGRIGEQVNGRLAVRLDGILSRAGQRKQNRVLLAAGANVSGKRPHDAFFRAQRDAHLDRPVGFKRQEERLLRLVDRALTAGPRRVVGKFRYAGAIDVCGAGIERYGKSGPFGLGRASDFQHGVDLLLHVLYRERAENVNAGRCILSGRAGTIAFKGG